MWNSVRWRLLLGACALQISALAAAQTQGNLGATSTGSVTIDAVVPGRVQITGLDDVDFGTVEPTGAASEVQDVCVWSNASGRAYNITATGDGGAGTDFSVTDGTNTLDYEVQWNDSAAQTSGTSLTSGTPLTGLSSTAINPTCSAGPSNSASLIVNLSAANLEAAVAGTYTGALTLVVAPE